MTHLLAQTYTDVSQGGRFDGILGVLAGLEVIKAMNASDHKPWADIAIINWTNEYVEKRELFMIFLLIRLGRGQTTPPAAQDLQSGHIILPWSRRSPCHELIISQPSVMI